jgi:2'-5' RNA ligase
MRRLFFALWPDSVFIEQLLRALGPLDAGAGRAVAAADLHVTLCFLGAVEQALIPALCERAAAIKAREFELVFEAFEYWPRSRTLSVAGDHAAPVEASELVQALRASARALGLSPDEQPLKAHVTLLRGVAGAAGLVGGPRALAAPLRLAARCFHLAQSHALERATAATAQLARYTRLASWPLSATRG